MNNISLYFCQTPTLDETSRFLTVRECVSLLALSVRCSAHFSNGAFYARVFNYTWVPAVENGVLSAIKWMHANNIKNDMNLIDTAALRGHLDIVKWLHENDGVEDCCSPNAMNWAAGKGHLEIVRWLHENRSEGCTTDAMDLAAHGGHLNVLQWLREHRSEGCTQMSVCWAAREGHFDVVQWLHTNYPATDLNPDAGFWAAYFGHFDIVKYLHGIKGNVCRARSAGNPLQAAIKRGHRHIAQWLRENCEMCRKQCS